MKSYRKELTFHIKTRRAYINITPQVEATLAESGIREGLCLVNAMNITASVFINDNDPAYTAILNAGWKNSRRKSPTTNIITMDMRTTPTPISSVPSWGVSASSPLQTENWILAHGSKFFMANLTAC